MHGLGELCLPVDSFTKDIYWRLARRPLVFNGRLASRQLKEATENKLTTKVVEFVVLSECGFLLMQTIPLSDHSDQLPCGRIDNRIGVDV